MRHQRTRHSFQYRVLRNSPRQIIVRRGQALQNIQTVVRASFPGRQGNLGVGARREQRLRIIARGFIPALPELETVELLIVVYQILPILLDYGPLADRIRHG